MDKALNSYEEGAKVTLKNIVASLSSSVKRPSCFLVHRGIYETTSFQDLRNQVKDQTFLYSNDAKELLKWRTPEEFLRYFYEQGVKSGNEKKLTEILTRGGEGVVVILDDINLDCTQKGTPVGDVINRLLLPKCSVVLTCDIHNFEAVREFLEPLQKYVVFEEVNDKNDQMEFLDALNNICKSDRMADYIKTNCRALCSNPGLVRILLKEFSKRLPNTYTSMMETLVLIVTKMHPDVKALNLLPGRAQMKFSLLCKLAYTLWDGGKILCDFDDVSKCLTLSSLAGAFNSMTSTVGMGLLVFYDSKDEIKFGLYKFLHLTFQEFLAAYHIANEPVFRQIDIFHDADLWKHKNVCKFFFGFGNILSDSESGFKSLKSESSYALGAILANFNLPTSQKDYDNIIFVYQLLHECQDSDLIRKFFSRKEKRLQVALDTATSSLSESLVITLSYVVAHSGVSKWAIQAPSSSLHSAEFISLLAKKQSAKKVEVSVTSSKKGSFVLQPLAKKAEKDKLYPRTCTIVRCMREMLHRVLQLYSPIKLKSDSSEPSYVSFLACECLKVKFETEQLLLFEPIQAIHWLSVPGKSKKPGGTSSKGDKEALELHWHMQTHNFEHLELVIMMSPLPHRVYYKDPSSSERRCIDLYKEEVSKPPVERSFEYSMDSPKQEKCNHSSGYSELISLAFPLPKSDKDILKSVVLDRGTFSKKNQSTLSVPKDYENAESAFHAKGHSIAPMVEQKILEVNPMNLQQETPHEALPRDVGSPKKRPPEEFIGLKQFGAEEAIVQESEAPREVLPRDVGSLKKRAPEEFMGLKQFGAEEAIVQESEAPREVLPRDVGSPKKRAPEEFIGLKQFGAEEAIVQESKAPREVPPKDVGSPKKQAPEEFIGLQQSGAEEAVVQESVQSQQIHRQVAARPGTIIYTAHPEVFVQDMIYGCPDENNLIKKGGNGLIYSAVYGSNEYAVKKTPYRSREIEIHKKLRHPNVIELVCLMFGDQQPQQKRRYFSYHFMPRLSGDLSRLVTNKPELTMVNLSQRYSSYPRTLGAVQGNWKYILKEVLKGLDHMHYMNIIHRDVKASNILINMFCGCDNPLTCACPRKFTVCIADFDAAIELDTFGSLLPVTLQGYHHSPTSTRHPIYQIMPVGTEGYRAPESAQTILSSDLSSLDPPLTIKADIWSVGLILLRMLNGSNGPTRQQKLSTLLLYYEQGKKSIYRPQLIRRFPSIGKNVPSIGKDEVDKIIGLTALKTINNDWVARAVRCIANCVEIDPRRRPAARELLLDPFLR